MSFEDTLANVRYVADNWPDGVHTCAQLQLFEPGRRACSCGTCRCYWCGRTGQRLTRSDVRTDKLICQDPGECARPIADDAGEGRHFPGDSLTDAADRIGAARRQCGRCAVPIVFERGEWRSGYTTSMWCPAGAK